MTTFFKWFTAGSLAVIFVCYVAYSGSVQNVATRTLSETDVTMHTVGVGGIRTHLDENGSLQKDIVYIDKDEILENLIEEIANTQKNLTYDIQFDYVFVDAGGNATNIDEQIRGIQYRVQYLDKNGNIKGTAERHLTLNQLK